MTVPGIRLCLGIGMSSAATTSEVDQIARRTVAEAGYALSSVTVVATRTAFAGDARLPADLPVTLVDDATVRACRPAPDARFGARVAEGCALIAAGPGATLIVPTRRSAHVTAALAGAAAPHGAFTHG